MSKNLKFHYKIKDFLDHLKILIIKYYFVNSLICEQVFHFHYFLYFSHFMLFFLMNDFNSIRKIFIEYFIWNFINFCITHLNLIQYLQWEFCFYCQELYQDVFSLISFHFLFDLFVIYLLLRCFPLELLPLFLYFFLLFLFFFINNFL